MHKVFYQKNLAISLISCILPTPKSTEGVDFYLKDGVSQECRFMNASLL